MVKFYKMYKCRLCGEEFSSFRGNRISAESCMYRLFENSDLKTLENARHNCTDGSIGFADFCGFKRKEVDREIKILFVSESQNKSGDFLKEIKSDLEKLGVLEIKEDNKECLIKTKDFTIKGKSIFDKNIYLECEKCEYILMDIVCIEKEKAPTFGEIMECFRWGAIELRDKKELIEFLTEE